MPPRLYRSPGGILTHRDPTSRMVCDMAPPIGAHIAPYFSVAAADVNTHSFGEMVRASSQYFWDSAASFDNSFSANDRGSVEFWFRLQDLPSAGGVYGLVTNWPGSGSHYWEVSLVESAGSQLLLLQASQDGGGTTGGISAWSIDVSGSIFADTWHHALAWFDLTQTPTSAQVGFILDAVDMGTPAVAVDGAITSFYAFGTPAVAVGARRERTISTHTMAGWIDSVRIHDVVRDAAWAFANMGKEIDPSTPGLIHAFEGNNDGTDEVGSDLVVPVNGAGYDATARPVLNAG